MCHMQVIGDMTMVGSVGCAAAVAVRGLVSKPTGTASTASDKVLVASLTLIVCVSSLA